MNDYVTRREAYALVVHVVNDVLSSEAFGKLVGDAARHGTDDPAKAACAEAFVGYESVPTDSEGAES
jgi:hypothetical protein